MHLWLALHLELIFIIFTVGVTFSVVITFSGDTGAWQKQVFCFFVSIFAYLLEGFVLTACKKKMLCQVPKLRELSF